MNSSKNLFHIIKHNYLSAEELTTYLVKNPNAERRIGCLPSDWLKNIEHKNISKITQLVDDVFEKVSEKTKSSVMSSKKSKSINNILIDFYLKVALCKILKRFDIKVKYNNQGSFKICRKITVGDYSYALSTFKKRNYDIHEHGRVCEPQNSFLAYKRMSKGRVAKPFMARLSAESDTEGGYILSQFIEENPKTKNKSNLTKLQRVSQPFFFTDAYFGLNDNAYHRNTINGVLIDVGGLKKNKISCDNQVKKLAMQIEQKLINNSGLYVFSDNYGVDVDLVNKYLLKQIAKGINIYNADLREILSGLKPLEQRFAQKEIRKLRKLKDFLENMSEEQKRCYDNALKYNDFTSMNILEESILLDPAYLKTNKNKLFKDSIALLHFYE